MSTGGFWKDAGVPARHLRSPFRRYLFAVLCVAIATALQFGVSWLGPSHLPFLAYYPMIVLAAMWAGFGPGILATSLAAATGGFLFLEPRYSFAVRSPEDLVGPALFAIIGVFLTFLACSGKQARQALRASEQDLRLSRALIDHSSDAVEVLEPETQRFLDVNDKGCRDLGYSREELLSMTVWETNPAMDADLYKKTLTKAREAGYAILECVHRRKDGSTFPVEVSLRCAKLDREYIIAVCRDISERQQSEKALRQSEDRYRDLVEHTEDLVCTHDLQGRLISVNPVPARLLGYEVAELLQIPMRDLVAPECRDQFEAYLQRIRAVGADRGFLCVLTRSGERRIWEYRNTLRTEGVAQPVVRGIGRDVTECKRAEAALRSSEQRYRLLFEKTVAGVAIASLDGKVVDCNQAWVRMLGYEDADQVRGRTTTDFYFNPGEREPLLEELKNKGACLSREMQLRRRDGSPVWVLYSSVVLPADDGATVLQATVIDVSERKRAEAELREREQDYRSFVAQSSEGIFRQDLDAPIPVDLPEDELAQRILHDSYLAECNQAIVKMYGLNSVEDFLGKRLTETLDPTDPRNIELAREYIRSGFRVLERESHETDMSGNPKVFRNSLIGIVENGKLIRTWGIQRDVTEQVRLEAERRETEKALRRSEEHFRILVEQAPDGIFIADPSGKYLDVNSTGVQMLGYPREEILRMSISDVLVREEVPRALADIPRLHSGQSTSGEWKIRRKDGSVFSGEVYGRALPDGRLQGILRDITERKRFEEMLRQSAERFRVALQESPITVFSQDRDLRYTWIFNPHLYWQHEIIGKTDAEILGAEASRRLTELKKQVLNVGVGARKEIVIRHNGTKFAFDLTIEPLFDDRHDVVGITGASVDIARLRELADALQNAKDKLAREKSYLEEEIQTQFGFEKIIGQSTALLEVLKKARVVAPTDSTVLLLGETGTGKELVARSIHSLSSRNDKNFIKLNCAAVPSGLLESELFGHEKGAFTGAVSQKIGRLELADKGTMFLDEVGELPLELQPKLLRVLQDREFERLGGIRTLHVDVRIISATNRDLAKDVAARRFREDLFYRLNVFPITMPPLRERRPDIATLVHHFVCKHSARMGKTIETIPPETLAVLENWSWPGNIRELENLIERMVILTKGRVLAPPPAELSSDQQTTLDDLTEMEREHIIRVLRETHGILSGAGGAASRLGVKRTTLQSMLKRLNIQPGEFRGENSIAGPE